jgi:uncharacterized protein (DUF2164 family)
MPELKRDWDVLTPEEHQKILGEIMTFFLDERGEKIGIVAAGQILDFFLQTIGNPIYNKALDDLKPLLEKKLGDTLFDIDTFLRKQG